MSSILKDVAAVQPDQQTDVIGHLTWCSMGEMLITTDELRTKLVQSGLGDGWMPKPIRLPDAFRRATADKFKRQIHEHVVENYHFREVVSDNQIVQRNLICETVNKKDRSLTYQSEVAVLVLDRNTNMVNYSSTTAMADELAKNAVAQFDIYKYNYGSQTLRTLVNAVLKSMAPTPVRPAGGVYFVPQKFEGQLDALLRFASSLDKGEGEKVPLINSRDMKGLINRKLQEHLQQTLKNCEAGITNAILKGQMKELLDEAKRVAEDYKQYASIVTDDLQGMESCVTLIREKVALALANMAV